MPKKTRKYPTKKKTTTRQGKAEYQKFLMRNRREEKKNLRAQILADPKKLQQLRNDFPLIHRFVVGTRVQKKPKRRKK